MDATFNQIVIGLLTNALSGVLEKSWSSGNQITLEGAVDASVAEISEIDRIGDEVGADELERFLGSPEAATSVRLLFVAGVHRSEATSDELRDSFTRAFERALPEAPAGKAAELFGLLAAATERTLTDAAAGGDNQAREAVGANRFRCLSEELEGLKRSLEALHEAEQEDIESFLEWEREYRVQVLTRQGTITPPSFDASERVPMDEIYVDPSFVISETSNWDLHLGRDELARRIGRTVVLGDPGAGKSTFVRKLAFDLVREQVSVGGAPLTPLLVTLKDYGAEKELRRVSLLEWIETTVKTDYSVPAPDGAIPYLLAAGRVVVLLDGLDELLDTSYRREITADVETFAARYVATPILVTSRRIGYAQAPLDQRRFEIARLMELDDEQVERYTRLWFGLRKELPERERTRMAADFMRDSAGAASDLRSNTLMLALLCNIYRGDGYIPRHRPQVYEKCAVMLFERWDRGRRIEVPLEFERHLRPAMQHLAFWIYSEPSLRGGVTEAALVRSATEFLSERRFDDEDAARQEARRFVEFCRGRAWVFTDTGTDRDGESLYQFTHRTFLEFFAAEHLVRTNPTPAELGAVLRPHIREGEWDVVAQLAFQLQDDNIDGAGDGLLAGLLEESGSGAGGDVVLSFAARSLSFLVPRRQTCRDVARSVTARLCDWLLNPAPKSTELSTTPVEAFRALVYVDRENFDPVAEVVRAEAVEFMAAEPSLERAEIALEVAASLDIVTWGQGQNENMGRWAEAEAEAFAALWPSLRLHLPQSFPIAFDAFRFGAIDLEEFVAAHPAFRLFKLRGFRLFDNYYRSSIAETCLKGQLGLNQDFAWRGVGGTAEMDALGRILESNKAPWQHGDINSGWVENFFKQGARPVDQMLEGTALWAAFGLVAIAYEHTAAKADRLKVLDWLSGTPGWPRALAPWVRRRTDSAASEDLRELPLEASLMDRIRSWADGEWSAVEIEQRFREVDRNPAV